MDDKNVIELLSYTRALLLLQVQALNKGDEPLKLEVLLARAGLPAREIANLLGKKPAAVAKAIERGRKAAA